MEVSWQPLTLAEARGFVSGYLVAYSPQVASSSRKRQESTVEMVPGMDSSSVTIRDLDPNTDYSVQVSAVTGGGPGVVSESFTAPIPAGGTLCFKITIPHKRQGCLLEPPCNANTCEVQIKGS